MECESELHFHSVCNNDDWDCNCDIVTAACKTIAMAQLRINRTDEMVLTANSSLDFLCYLCIQCAVNKKDIVHAIRMDRILNAGPNVSPT